LGGDKKGVAGAQAGQGKVTLAWTCEVEPVNYSRSEFNEIFNRVSNLGAMYGNLLIRNLILHPELSPWEVQKLTAEASINGKTFKELLPDAVRSGYYFSELRAKRKQIREARRLRISLPSFKAGSIPVRDRVWKFVEQDGWIGVRVPILKEGEQPVLRFRDGYKKNKAYVTILERIRSGEYKPGSLKIVKKNGRFFVSISYSFTPPEREVVPGRVMGIDLGIHSPVYIAFSDSPDGVSFEGESSKLLKVKADLSAKYAQIRSWIMKPGVRSGHGRRYKFAPLGRIKRKWQGFVRWWIDHIANEVCKIAKKEKVEAVAVEDLNLRSPNFFSVHLGASELKFPVGRLLQTIKYKLEAEGIRVVEVDPRGTTKICSNCGREKEIPLEERVFRCECGLERDRDWNAARNIALRGREVLLSAPKLERD